MQDQLDPEQFRKWRDAAKDRAEDKDVADIARELYSLAENGETMTMSDAKILGMSWELRERLTGDVEY